MDIMRDIYEKLLDDGEEEEIYEDISEEVTSSTEGVTENCRNYGKVEGDVDTGGSAAPLRWNTTLTRKTT